MSGLGPRTLVNGVPIPQSVQPAPVLPDDYANLMITAMGPVAIPAGPFFQVPYDVLGPVNGMGQITGPLASIGVAVAGDYEIEYTLPMFLTAIAPGATDFSAIASVNGSPTGPGSPIVSSFTNHSVVGVGALDFTLSNQTLATLAAGDLVSVWVVASGAGLTVAVRTGTFSAIQVG